MVWRTTEFLQIRLDVCEYVAPLRRRITYGTASLLKGGVIVSGSCVAGKIKSDSSPREATGILPSLNVKTARSWCGIVPFTHLAREGRMTVTIGRRELLAALGGAVAARGPRAISGGAVRQSRLPSRLTRLFAIVRRLASKTASD